MPWLLDERARPVPVRSEEAGSATTVPPDLTPLGLLPAVAAWPDGGGEARAWLTEEPAVEPCLAWRSVARAFDRTGLWPLVVTTYWERLSPVGEPTRPAVVPEAEDVLRQSWEGTRLVRPDGTLLPHRPWPGLAEPSGAPDGGTALLPDPPYLEWPRHLLLVPATRPADSPARLGWYGAGNWSLSGDDIAAVLRSWEDRFGAYVVGIGCAELDLAVTRPPVTWAQRLVVADEHYAFCPDNFAPQNLPEPVVFSRGEYADRLGGARVWHFWWD